MFVFQMRLSFLLSQQCSINVLLTLIYWSWNSTAQWMLMSFKQMEKTYECLPSSSLGQLHQVAGEVACGIQMSSISPLQRNCSTALHILTQENISPAVNPSASYKRKKLLWFVVTTYQFNWFYNQIFYPHRKWISTVKCNNKLKKYTWD